MRVSSPHLHGNPCRFQAFILDVGRILGGLETAEPLIAYQE
jgi:hypothetical protein